MPLILRVRATPLNCSSRRVALALLASGKSAFLSHQLMSCSGTGIHIIKTPLSTLAGPILPPLMMNQESNDHADGLGNDPWEDAFVFDEDRDTAVAAVAPAAQLATIWDCPQIMKFMQGDKRVWTCAWCPNEPDGSRPKPFQAWHVTKAISHVCRISGMCIHLCNGEIPPDFALKYKDLYLRQELSKEKRSGAVDQMNASISDTQTSAVSAITNDNMDSSLSTTP